MSIMLKSQYSIHLHRRYITIITVFYFCVKSYTSYTDINLLKQRILYKLATENLQDNFKSHKNNSESLHFYTVDFRYLEFKGTL